MLLQDETTLTAEYLARRYDFLKKRTELGRKKHYSVAIFGTGRVAEMLAVLIAHDRKKYYGEVDINHLFIVSQNLKRAEGLSMCFDDVREDITIEFRDYSSIQKIKELSDIIVILADNKPANEPYLEKHKGNLPPDFRLYLTQNNIKPIDEIVKLLSAGAPFEKTLAIVSNQCDLLATSSSYTTGIDQRQIVAVGHIDTRRQWNDLLKVGKNYFPEAVIKAALPTCAYVYGAHDETMVPAISTVQDSEVVHRLLILNEQRKDDIKTRASTEASKTGNVPAAPGAKAILDIIEAIITEQKPVSAGIYLTGREPMFTQDPDYPKYRHFIEGTRGIHIGFPTFFEDGKAQPLPFWGSEEERRIFFELFWHIPLEDKIEFFGNNFARYNFYFTGLMDSLGLKVRQLPDPDYDFRISRPAIVPPQVHNATIGLDTLLYTIGTGVKINIYKPGISTASQTIDLRIPDGSIRAITADSTSLCAIAKVIVRPGQDPMYLVISSDSHEPKMTLLSEKSLSSIIRMGSDIICSIDDDSNEAAIIFKPGNKTQIIYADESLRISGLAIGGTDVYALAGNQLYRLDKDNFALVTEFAYGDSLKILAAAEGKAAFVSNPDGKVYAADAAQSTMIAEYNTVRGVYDAVVDNDGRILLALVEDGALVLRKFDSIMDLLMKKHHFIPNSGSFADISSIKIGKDFIFLTDDANKVHLVNRDYPDLRYVPLELEGAVFGSHVWVMK